MQNIAIADTDKNHTVITAGLRLQKLIIFIHLIKVMAYLTGIKPLYLIAVAENIFSAVS